MVYQVEKIQSQEDKQVNDWPKGILQICFLRLDLQPLTSAIPEENLNIYTIFFYFIFLFLV